MGELAISDTPGDVLVSLGLGSCIGLALIDQRAGVAGLAHVMLPATLGHPEAGGARQVRRPRGARADRRDGRARRLAGAPAGRRWSAARACSPPRLALDVGARNATAVRELVAARRVPVVAEAAAARAGAPCRVDVASRAVTVREAGGSASRRCVAA